MIILPLLANVPNLMTVGETKRYSESPAEQVHSQPGNNPRIFADAAAIVSIDYLTEYVRKPLPGRFRASIENDILSVLTLDQSG